MRVNLDLMRGWWFRAAIAVVSVARPGAAEDMEARTSPAPLGVPIYVASPLDGGAIAIDGRWQEPAWRETALGWGLSHAHEPDLLCPDPTLFRIGYDQESLYLALAGYQRDAQEELPEHIWKPQESGMMDMQAVPRHARERGIVPPINTIQVLISKSGRTVTLTFAPPKIPTAKVHDTLGERELELKLEHAYGGDPEKALWTGETRIAWSQLGFEPPAEGEDWALNLYREIRFLSNWSFIAWMRDWNKAEYSRYQMTDRFGRLIFAGQTTEPESIESAAKKWAARRGPVRVFTAEALLLVNTDGRIVRQRYADRVKVLRAYADGIRRQRSQIGSDLPYYPFFTEKKPREHLAPAGRRLSRLFDAAREAPLLDDPACAVARISHAIPEAREGLYTYKKERLYRGLPE
jgi:hypothetical protein